MQRILKIVLTILGLAYIISPYDTIPDFVPVLGQADDLFVLGALLFYFWREYLPRLPWLRRDSNAEADGRGPGREESSESAADENTGHADPYEVLGLRPGAGSEEIRAAYRQASQRYHPDKVSHLGQEFQDLARKKFIDIQRAYEELRRRGGW